jgi:hypothetical protein
MLTLFTPVTVTYDAATTAWINAVVAAGGTVSSGRRTTVDNFIIGLKADGIWTKLDRLWLFAAENRTSADIDIKALTATSVVTGGPVFTADLGISCNASSYLSTNFNLSTNGVNFLQGSAHMACWNLTDGTGTDPTLVTSGGAINGLIPKYTDANVYARLNDAAPSGSPGAIGGDCRGWLSVNRDSVTQKHMYVNGANFGSYPADSSQAPENLPIIVYARQSAAVSLGGSLNASEQLAFYNRLRTYMTAVGVP